MNNVRRKKISSIINKLEICKMELDLLKDEEQDCFDNLPEGIQGSDRGCEMEEYIEIMENAVDDIDEIVDNLNEII